MSARRFDGMVGVGGIGSGSFFLLNGNATLGREESRSGRFLDRRDYCKLHIIAHYVRALLGAAFEVIPVGKVGDDDVGRRLVAEMAEAGLAVHNVEVEAESPTLFSFCYLYPDGSGGNLTTGDSACAHVDPAFVARAEPHLERLGRRGVALAAPEVSLAARAKLLDLAGAHGLFRVASFTAEEMEEAMRTGMLRSVDLVSLNLGEAAATVGLSAEGDPVETIVDAAIDAMSVQHDALQIAITHGNHGSWTWEGTSVTHLPAVPASVACTAGAGDAFLAGLVAGVAHGLELPDAHHVGALAGAASVTSPHTIHKELCRASLETVATAAGHAMPESVRAFLKEE